MFALEALVIASFYSSFFPTLSISGLNINLTKKLEKTKILPKLKNINFIPPIKNKRLPIAGPTTHPRHSANYI